MNHHAYVYEHFMENVTSEGVPIPEYLYMMRHPYRGKVFPGADNAKSIYRTDQVMAVHNHLAMRCLNTKGHHSCWQYDIDPKDSVLMHYRRNREPDPKCTVDNFRSTPECGQHDPRVQRYLEPIQTRVVEQLKQIFG